MSDIRIGKIKIGLNNKPFIIAEMSGNHNQSLKQALKITEAAAKAGAHALKLQTYTADTLTLNIKNDAFMLNDASSLWKGSNLYELFGQAHTPWEWHAPIMKRAKELGLICFSTPFDETAVDFLEKLNVPAYKIASFELNHIPLIQKVAATGKPMIMSTGMATQEDIQEAIDTARGAGCKEIILLKCTSSYPAEASDANIRTIPHMRQHFGCETGLSDHTLGIGVSVAAVTQGATVIEKHFTLRREDGGVDSAFSIEPGELRALVVETERAWQSLGSVRYGVGKAEKASLQERRSLYIGEDMKKGDTFNQKNLRCIRPSYGLHPRYYKSLLGQKVNRDVSIGTPLSWKLVSNASAINSIQKNKKGKVNKPR